MKKKVSILFLLFWFFSVALSWASRLEVMPPLIKVEVPEGGNAQAVIYIIDADGNNTDFTWQLTPDRPWIIPETVSGQGPSIVNITLTDDEPEQTVGSISVYSEIGESFVTIRRTVTEISKQAFSFALSPSLISVEITRIPGAEVQSRQIQIGLSCLNEPEDGVSCFAATDQPWLTVEDEPSCDSSFTLNIAPDQDLPEGNYTGTISVTCDNQTQQVTVFLFLNEVIGDQLVLSPKTLEINLTKAQLLPQVFPLKIYNANPEGRNFSWRAESLVPWLELKPDQGTASSKEKVAADLIVDPRGLPAGSYSGIVRFYSDLDENSATKGIDLEVTLNIYPWQTLEVFPAHFYWAIRRSENGTIIGSLPSERLHIYAGPSGWSLSTDVSWLALSSLWPEDAPEGYIEVTPVAELIQVLPLGRYEARIRVTDRESGFYRIVPVTLDILRPEDPVLLPALPPTFSQLTPDFVRIEAAESNLLEMVLPAAAPSPTSERECLDLLGIWEENRCQFQNRVYFIMYNSDVWPGTVWSWIPTQGRFVIIEKEGQPVKEADQLFASLGPIADLSFGPVPLAGLWGDLFFEVKVGTNYLKSRTLQRIEVQIYTPEGAWSVVDYYKGVAWPHPRLLVFRKTVHGWEACWEEGGFCLLPVKVIYGDGKNFLYQWNFQSQGYIFEYQVKTLTATEMRGIWRYFDGDHWSSWESFEATRQIFPLPKLEAN